MAFANVQVIIRLRVLGIEDDVLATAPAGTRTRMPARPAEVLSQYDERESGLVDLQQHCPEAVSRLPMRDV